MFIAHHKTTGVKLHKRNRDYLFPTQAAAKAAITRHCNASTPPLDPNLYDVTEDAAYRELFPVGMRVVTNLMSGKEVLESVDTPWCCSVASETYWCS